MSDNDRASNLVYLAISQHELRRRTPAERKAYYQGFLAGLDFAKIQTKHLEEQIEDMIAHGHMWMDDG
jgi:hypothetical protein